MRRMGGERTGATYEENPQQKAEAELQEVFRSFEQDPLRRGIVPAFEELGYGDMTPIPHEIFDELPDNHILMTNDCVKGMEDILGSTISHNVEVPFVLIGETEGNTNKVFFDKIYTIPKKLIKGLEGKECNINMVERENRDLIPNFEDRIEEVAKLDDGSRAIICFGHTHPARGGYYGTYSRADLRNLIQYDDSIAQVKREMKDNDDIPVEVKREIENNGPQTLSCVIAANGDMDFMFYDHERKNFYKFTNVLGMNSNDINDGAEMLQNYTFKTVE